MASLKNTLVVLFAILTVIGCGQKKEGKTIILQPDQDDGGLVLPDGFRALVVADSVGPTRHIAVNQNGDIYAKLRISKGSQGTVALRDTDGDGKADMIQRFGDYPNDGSFATDMRIYNATCISVQNWLCTAKNSTHPI
ncbi:MAG: hypothetical protein ACKOEV_01905 [Cytophagales bacterium]